MEKLAMKGAKVVTQAEHTSVRATTVTIVPNTERPGFSIIESEGVRDDDMPIFDSTWNHSSEQIIEIHEDQAVAEARAKEFNETLGYSNMRPGSGEETWQDEWREYRVGNVTLRLCMVEEIAHQPGEAHS